MSYQVLARKWRPKSFASLVGQNHVQKALTNALNSGRIHHAYLFTGTRGVGKTTISRILAKSLNCEQGISAQPCCECQSCLDIDAGQFVDLIEVDAASRTKVEDTREILDNVQYRPSRGRYKVYLIDEVHMLSNSSFNALLKTLEEPPEHVVFFLATTDPQKIPATVLSRCLQFHLKSLTVEQIAGQLHSIINAENMQAESEALDKLAFAADGSMRDGLSLLDQAIAHSNADLSLANVNDMLGTVDFHHVENLLAALIADEPQQLLECLQEIKALAPDYSVILEEFIQLLHQIALYQVTRYIASNNQAAEAIRQFAEQISQADVQLFYQLALHGRRDLPLAPQIFQGLEMTFLRLLAFRPMPEQQESHRQHPPGNLSRKVKIATESIELASNNDQKTAVETPVAALKKTVANNVSTSAPTGSTEPAQAIKVSDLSSPGQIKPAVNASGAPAEAAILEPATSVLNTNDQSTEQNTKPAPVKTADDEAASPLALDFFGADDQFVADDKTITEQSDLLSSTKQRASSVLAAIPSQEAALDEPPTVVPSDTVIPDVEQHSNSAEAQLVGVGSSDNLPDVLSPEAVSTGAPAVSQDQPATALTPDQLVLSSVDQVTNESWIQIVDQCQLSGLIEQIAHNSSISRIEKDRLVLSVQADVAQLCKPDRLAKLQSLLQPFILGVWRLDCESTEVLADTPRHRQEQQKQAKFTAAVESLQADKKLQMLQMHFDVELNIDKITVK